MKKIFFLPLFTILSSLIYANSSFVIKPSGLYKNGEFYQVFSGTLQYARIPESAWEDRLQKARAMGLNTISTSIFWNFHEEKEGIFDFTTGRKNIAKFIRLAEKQGLNVILKPGPYVNADWDMGGIPSWLLTKDNMRFRSTNNEFLKYTRKYLSALVFAIKGLQEPDGGPIIMMQLEDHYGSFGNDEKYLENLRDIYREVGLKTALFTTDIAEIPNLEAGSIDSIMPTISFESKAKKHFETLRISREDKALMAGEFRIGKITFNEDLSWKKTSKGRIFRDLKWMIEKEKSFNIYPFSDGTNFKFWAGAHYEKGKYKSIPTRYNYGAPLKEDGSITPQYKKFRLILSKHQNRKEKKLPEVPKSEKLGKIKRIKFRYSASLLDNLREGFFKTSMPRPLEFYGTNTTMIVYKTILRGHREGILMIKAPHDIAHIYFAGKYLKTITRNDPKYYLKLPKIKKNMPLELIIIVESLGHISIGPELMDRKGITQYITLNDINIMNWEVFPIPFTDEFFCSLKYRQNFPFYEQPAIYAATFDIKRMGDLYLKTKNWTNGVIIVNGKVAGRYRKKSPQKEIYIPKNWLTEKNNTIYVFDMGLENLPIIYSK